TVLKLNPNVAAAALALEGIWNILKRFQDDANAKKAQDAVVDINDWLNALEPGNPFRKNAAGPLGAERGIPAIGGPLGGSTRCSPTRAWEGEPCPPSTPSPPRSAPPATGRSHSGRSARRSGSTSARSTTRPAGR